MRRIYTIKNYEDYFEIEEGYDFITVTVDSFGYCIDVTKDYVSYLYEEGFDLMYNHDYLITICDDYSEY